MKKFLFSFFLFLIVSVFLAGSVSAQEGSVNNVGGNEGTMSNSCPSGSVCLDNPLGKNVSTPQALIGKVINAVLGVVGSLALLMFVYGGLTWMTSSGSQEKVKKGRDIIIWSAIGLAVIFSAYALVRILITGVR